ncbi:thioredoxin family protein [Bacillus thuringiensis]|uniref:thioredoxin family protein n=1 Tax=Bacillus thuringiensis TaxID=1428 RepID=UPI000BFB9F86|nr:thioredoxin family protein [Bacillus thuringiensis]PGT89972.1 hypothetical protein COD17_09490 [Bacillus thuringiensis]
MTKKESKKKGYKDPTSRVTKGTVATLVSVLLITGGGCAWLMAKGVEQSKAIGQETQVKAEKPVTQEDNSQLNKITVGDFKNVLRAGEKQVVYIGRPTCPNCVVYRPIQDKALKDLDMKITYFNTDEGRKEDAESMKQVMETLNVEGVPTLALVNNGKVEELAPVPVYTDQTGQALKDWLGKVAPKK